MRDVSGKINTLRTARAEATIVASPALIATIKNGKVPKGDPLPVAKVAAVQAAKNTSAIIPYCHPLPVEYVGVEFELLQDSIRIVTEVKAVYKTGVEMEALTAASVAALTIYDMLKMLDETMAIENIKLLEKTGGKSDFKDKFGEKLKAAVLVMSDSIASGKKQDASGKAIVERLEQMNIIISDYKIIADDEDLIRQTVIKYCDADQLDLVITTGGTGLSLRDCTPEAMKNIIEKEVPGIAEAARSYGQDRMPYSMLSRGVAGVRGKTLVINLPGSRGGVLDSLDALFPQVLHVFSMMRGGGHSHKH